MKRSTLSTITIAVLVLISSAQSVYLVRSAATIRALRAEKTQLFQAYAGKLREQAIADIPASEPPVRYVLPTAPASITTAGEPFSF